jgi:hypothetical protein
VGRGSSSRDSRSCFRKAGGLREKYTEGWWVEREARGTLLVMPRPMRDVSDIAMTAGIEELPYIHSAAGSESFRQVSPRLGQGPFKGSLLHIRDFGRQSVSVRNSAKCFGLIASELIKKGTYTMMFTGKRVKKQLGGKRSHQYVQVTKEEVIFQRNLHARML